VEWDEEEEEVVGVGFYSWRRRGTGPGGGGSPDVESWRGEVVVPRTPGRGGRAFAACRIVLGVFPGCFRRAFLAVTRVGTPHAGEVAKMCSRGFRPSRASQGER
jgi:hypothetical protein